MAPFISGQTSVSGGLATSLSPHTPVCPKKGPYQADAFFAFATCLNEAMSRFDVVGVGLNATDTLILLPHFPAYAGKIAFDEEILSPGGQVASAMVTCARLGLSVKYIGTVGDDERGRVQVASLRETGINLDDVQVRQGCPNQTAYILIDRSTGERTVLWRRDDALRLDPSFITPEKIFCARLLHIDGHDTPAVERAARLARERGIPVTVDVDTVYHGFDRVLPLADYLIASSEFPAQWTSERDPFKALELMQNEYGIRVAAMTLGALRGALCLLARLRGQLRRHHRRRRRLSRGLLLFCVAGDVLAGEPRLFQRHGGAELHRDRRARRHSRSGRGGGIDGPSRAPLAQGFRNPLARRLTP